MTDEEKITRMKTLENFNRELDRGGEETLEVPAWIAEEYSVFPEDAGRRTRRSGAEERGAIVMASFHPGR